MSQDWCSVPFGATCSLVHNLVLFFLEMLSQLSVTLIILRLYPLIPYVGHFDYCGLKSLYLLY